MSVLLVGMTDQLVDAEKDKPVGRAERTNESLRRVVDRLRLGPEHGCVPGKGVVGIAGCGHVRGDVGGEVEADVASFLLRSFAPGWEDVVWRGAGEGLMEMVEWN